MRRAIERLPFAFEEGPTGGALVVARGETYTLPEISAFVLRGVRAQAEEALEQPCRRAVITVPANFNELQRSATKAAGRVAGLEVLRILNEPTAAALAYGCGASKKRERVAVYDLGGGTFDITILELAGDVFEVVATAGDTFLGGDDIDVAGRRRDGAGASSRSTATTRAATRRPTSACAPRPSGPSASSPPRRTSSSRSRSSAYGAGGAALDLASRSRARGSRQLARPLIARTFDVCEEAMRLARPAADPARPGDPGRRQHAHAAACARWWQEYFGREPLATIDPDLVVAQGAAIQGAALAGQPESARPPARAPAIGRVALQEGGRAGRQHAARSQRRRGPRSSPSVRRPAAGSPPMPAGRAGAAPRRSRSKQPRADARARRRFRHTLEAEPDAA